jgi:hypothetical protein
LHRRTAAPRRLADTDHRHRSPTTSSRTCRGRDVWPRPRSSRLRSGLPQWRRAPHCPGRRSADSQHGEMLVHRVDRAGSGWGRGRNVVRARHRDVAERMTASGLRCGEVGSWGALWRPAFPPRSRFPLGSGVAAGCASASFAAIRRLSTAAGAISAAIAKRDASGGASSDARAPLSTTLTRITGCFGCWASLLAGVIHVWRLGRSASCMREQPFGVEPSPPASSSRVRRPLRARGRSRSRAAGTGGARRGLANRVRIAASVG